uniref:Uncharacterized protein n=1 Tax=Ursus maritimus TaxID=29073 RepID=A0A452V9F1_URSMA
MREKKNFEFYILFSPSTGVLQSCVVRKLAVHLFFQVVFWGRGLLPCFSGVFAWAELYCPLSGVWAQCNLFLVALCGFCSLKCLLSTSCCLCRSNGRPWRLTLSSLTPPPSLAMTDSRLWRIRKNSWDHL